MRSVIRVVINGGAAAMRDEKARAEVMLLLTDALPDAKVWCSSEQESVDALIRKAMSDSPTMLVAGGGDGTINAVAAAIIGTDIVLGVLPVGTLNHFAGDLGVPSEIAQAVALLRDGAARQIDVGDVNGRIFVNNAGLGLYPEIVRRREATQRRGIPKWPAALAAAFRALLRYRQFAIRIRVHDQVILRRTAALFVGNNEYANPDSLEPRRSSLDSGTLSLYLPLARGRLRLLWDALHALVGDVRESDGFDLVHAKGFVLESKQRMLHVSIDGEVTKLETPLTFASRPGALMVIAPAVESSHKSLGTPPTAA